MSRAEFMNDLKKEDIITQVHYMPVTSHPYYKRLGYKTSDYPSASKFYEEALSIPLYYSLSDAEQKKVINAILSLLS